MPEFPAPAVYESAALQAAAGPTLRPGGLALTERALSFCAFPVDARVADIGCGTGATTRHLERRCRLKAVGLDRSSILLGKARQQDSSLTLVRGEAVRLPFSGGALSGVICECVLSLVENTGAVLREFHRVLAPGGLLVLSDVYARAAGHAAGLTRLPGDCCLKGAMTRETLLRQMHGSGFTPLVWEDHSETLKRLAAEWVFAGGSLQALWGGAAAQADTEGYSSSVHRARPGYFLSVARKENLP